MGQSRTEFARRRREQRENRPNFLAVLDEVTQMVTIRHNMQPGDEIALLMPDEADDVRLNITQTYQAIRSNPSFQPVVFATSAFTPNGDPLDTQRAMEMPLELAMRDPLLVVYLPHGEPLLIDGNHRLYKMQQSGVQTFQAYVAPPSLIPLVVTEERRADECSVEILQNLSSEEDLYKIVKADGT